jgi:hypothetical protein
MTAAPGVVPRFYILSADYNHLSMNEVTRILDRIQDGESAAAEALLPLVYDELRKLAAGHMANEAPGHSLNATALVHEAYLRLLGPLGIGHSRIGATSLPLQPMQCAASWLIRLAASRL